jgi:DNA polymerase III subunit epsilon
MYAIVDIETTGSYAAANGITEIAIFISDGNRILDSYSTLVNPNQPIPHYIQSMTGITDKMVAKTPAFEKVAKKIFNLLQNKIFIAHNVNFDYSFVKSHLEANGFSFNTKKLCTVRLGRKILPGLPSYSLGKFCSSMGIPNNARHRAAGDAEATAHLFHLMVQRDTENHIEKSLQRNSKEQHLPPNVPKKDFEQLPTTPGVYYFHNEKGKIIYVGKARNIRSRISSHFSGDMQGRQKQNFIKHIHSISFQPTATELMAHILESTEIKKLWPIYNYSQKRWEDVYGIFSFEDQNGYQRIAIEKNKKNLNPHHTFHYLVDGHAIIRKLIKEYNLCPKLCFMQAYNIACEGLKDEICYGACEKSEPPEKYNNRVKKALSSLRNQSSFIIVDDGLHHEEKSCILVEHGSFKGMGYLPSEIQVTDPGSIKDHIKLYRENQFIRNIVLGYAARYPHKVIHFESETIIIEG